MIRKREICRSLIQDLGSWTVFQSLTTATMQTMEWWTSNEKEMNPVQPQFMHLNNWRMDKIQMGCLAWKDASTSSRTNIPIWPPYRKRIPNWTKKTHEYYNKTWWKLLKTQYPNPIKRIKLKRIVPFIVDKMSVYEQSNK